MSHLVPQDGKPKSAKDKLFQCDLNLSCFFYIWKRFKMLCYVNNNKDTHLQEMGLAGLSAGMNGQRVRSNPQRCIWLLCPCTEAEWESWWSHLLHRWSSVGRTEPGWPPAAVYPRRLRACRWSPDTSQSSCFHKNPWLLLRCDGKDSAGQRGSEKTISSCHKVRPDVSGNGKDRIQWHTGMMQKNHSHRVTQKQIGFCLISPWMSQRHSSDILQCGNINVSLLSSIIPVMTQDWHMIVCVMRCMAVASALCS